MQSHADERKQTTKNADEYRERQSHEKNSDTFRIKLNNSNKL